MWGKWVCETIDLSERMVVFDKTEESASADSEEEDAAERPGAEAHAGNHRLVVPWQQHAVIQMVGGTTPRARSSDAAHHSLAEECAAASWRGAEPAVSAAVTPVLL